MPNWGEFFTAGFVLLVYYLTFFGLLEGPGLKPGRQQWTATAWLRRVLGISPRRSWMFFAVLTFAFICATGAGFFVWWFIHTVWG